MSPSSSLLSYRFPEKLWEIIHQCKSNAISWNGEGDTVILNYKDFEKEYMVPGKGYFKTGKISSFIRQLNLYGFVKSREKTFCNSRTGRGCTLHEFSHAYFIRERKELLKHVSRNCPNITKEENLEKPRSNVGRKPRETKRQGKQRGTAGNTASTALKTSPKLDDSLNVSAIECARGYSESEADTCVDNTCEMSADDNYSQTIWPTGWNGNSSPVLHQNKPQLDQSSDTNSSPNFFAQYCASSSTSITAIPQLVVNPPKLRTSTPRKMVNGRVNKRSENVPRTPAIVQNPPSAMADHTYHTSPFIDSKDSVSRASIISTPTRVNNKLQLSVAGTKVAHTKLKLVALAKDGLIASIPNSPKLIKIRPKRIIKSQLSRILSDTTAGLSPRETYSAAGYRFPARSLFARVQQKANAIASFGTSNGTDSPIVPQQVVNSPKHREDVGLMGYFQVLSTYDMTLGIQRNEAFEKVAKQIFEYGKLSKAHEHNLLPDDLSGILKDLPVIYNGQSTPQATTSRNDSSLLSSEPSFTNNWLSATHSPTSYVPKRKIANRGKRLDVIAKVCRFPKDVFKKYSKKNKTTKRRKRTIQLEDDAQSDDEAKSPSAKRRCIKNDFVYESVNLSRYLKDEETSIEFSKEQRAALGTGCYQTLRSGRVVCYSNMKLWNGVPNTKWDQPTKDDNKENVDPSMDTDAPSSEDTKMPKSKGKK